MIVMYNPPSSARRKPVMPLSLLALGALLEGRHEYAIVDGNLDRDALGTIDRMVQNGADTLAITVMPGPQLADAVPLSRELKSRHPQLRIVWGGYFPTQHWDVCLSSGYVDYVVRGHGEVTFLSLLDRVTADADPTDLPGLAYRQPDGMACDRDAGHSAPRSHAGVSVSPHPDGALRARVVHGQAHTGAPLQLR